LACGASFLAENTTPKSMFHATMAHCSSEAFLLKNMKTISTAIILLFAFSISLLKADDLKFTKDKENVVSSRLSGSWIIEGALNLRLTGKDEVKDLKKVTFVGDDSVFDRLPGKYKKFLIKEQASVFMTGWMTFGKQKCPFFLVERKGNPHILFFLKVGDNVFGNGESFNVMMAVAEETENDLLFIGGDFNNQPFRAYRRVKK
jgi:hypothetical protein